MDHDLALIVGLVLIILSIPSIIAAFSDGHAPRVAAFTIIAGKVELVTSRAPWLNEPLPAAAILWVTALTATALPERNPYPSLYEALGALLDAICHAPSARGWAPALLSYEVLLLRELGYGGAKPEAGDLNDTIAVMRKLAPSLERYLLADRHGDAMAARTRLLERLARIA